MGKQTVRSSVNTHAKIYLWVLVMAFVAVAISHIFYMSFVEAKGTPYAVLFFAIGFVGLMWLAINTVRFWRNKPPRYTLKEYLYVFSLAYVVMVVPITWYEFSRISSAEQRAAALSGNMHEIVKTLQKLSFSTYKQ